MPKSRLVAALLVFLLCCLGSAAAYFLPPVRERLAWQVDSAWVGLVRFLNPPEQVVFVPEQGGAPGFVETAVHATLSASTPTAAQPPEQALSSPDPAAGESTPTTTAPAPTETPSPTPSPTPLPERALLSGLTHEPQVFNNCGPASLSMALSFWGWQGNQLDTRAYLRPNRDVDDKNVNPYEMVRFVEGFAGMKAVERVGGDLDTIRRFLAAGFPVLVEEGHDPLDDWWMGHYLVINGYDDASGRFTTQDSLLGSPDAAVPYERLEENWRDFNYLYLVIYPPEREAEVFSLLGAPADEAEAFRAAAELARLEIDSLQGRALLMAWFNLGSSLVGLGDYPLAAQAFDQAFEIYARLPEDKAHPDSRPFRLMWYRFGPYEAYYHTGRYQDVIRLADTTFMWVGRAVLEESFYWRALAYEATGEPQKAVADLRRALEINPNFSLAADALARIEGS